MGGGKGGRSAYPPAGARAQAVEIDFYEVAMDIADGAAADFEVEAQAPDPGNKPYFLEMFIFNYCKYPTSSPSRAERPGGPGSN